MAAAAGKGKDSSYLPLSMEYLTKENPQVIMLITMGDGKAVMGKLRQEMQQNPIWNELEAVQKHALVLADDVALAQCDACNTKLRLSAPYLKGAQIATHLPFMGERGADYLLEYINSYFSA